MFNAFFISMAECFIAHHRVYQRLQVLTAILTSQQASLAFCSDTSFLGTFRGACCVGHARGDKEK